MSLLTACGLPDHLFQRRKQIDKNATFIAEAAALELQILAGANGGKLPKERVEAAIAQAIENHLRSTQQVFYAP